MRRTALSIVVCIMLGSAGCAQETVAQAPPEEKPAEQVPAVPVVSGPNLRILWSSAPDLPVDIGAEEALAKASCTPGTGTRSEDSDIEYAHCVGNVLSTKFPNIYFRIEIHPDVEAPQAADMPSDQT